MSERCFPRERLRTGMRSMEPLDTLPRSSSSKQSRRRASKSVVERLQALRNGDELTEERILQEVLPNQKSVLLAAPLFDSPRRTTATRQGFTRQGPQKPTYRRHSRQQISLAPLPSDRVEDSLGEDTSVLVRAPDSAAKPYGEHALQIWEDKFAHHKLRIEDALYLLLHDELIAIIESAVLLKVSGMDANQLLEVEIALEQRTQQISSSGVVASRVGSRIAMARKTVCARIFENVWSHGCAFRGDFHNDRTEGEVICMASPNRERSVLSPVKSPLIKHSPISKKKPIVVQAIYSGVTNQDDFNRLSSDLKSSHHVLAVHTRDVLKSSRWIQEHCMQEMMSRNSALFLKLRKDKAAQILINTVIFRANRMTAARFQVWRTHTLSRRCQQLVTQYCKLKGASKILGLARRLQKRSFLWRWHRWMRRLKMEHKMERFAAAITVQSWARCVLAKHRRHTFHLERAAATLQSTWRGYYTRKMLRRRRRYEAYTAAASVVQRSYRAYYNRCQFAIHWARQKASCCITRSLRRYCAHRRMFKSWCNRVARFHSAAVIQVWLRKTLRRIREERSIRELQTSSAFTVQRFFRYARFLIVFGSRVKRLMHRKNAAAVKLQNAYRAKLARARFYALKDQIEAQRRREILQMMWDNAYATTIQRSWRKKRLWRMQRQQRVHQSPRSVGVDDPPLQLASDPTVDEHCE